ncbi:hypothetical protein L6452_05586 [Arctium lappa]|uniref:Uncharacterized protein n=1 Tax=Arctium lappa TaxID=4217 RepID=A0ACB9EGJ0_ARCLA|nr:hypothetical protein L6452_05586 [Arctium lappa]
MFRCVTVILCDLVDGYQKAVCVYGPMQMRSTFLDEWSGVANGGFIGKGRETGIVENQSGGGASTSMTCFGERGGKRVDSPEKGEGSG